MIQNSHVGEIFSKDFFPTLRNNLTLVYFDSAAMHQPHQFVLNAINNYYENFCSNTRGGMYSIAEQAHTAVDRARASVAHLLGAEPYQICFTSGATQSLNWIAEWNKHRPTVIISDAEHNSNILPWLAQGRDINNSRLAVLDTFAITPSQVFENAERLFSRHRNSAVLSITGASNVTGHKLPFEALSAQASSFGIPVCVDLCQVADCIDINLSAEPNIIWAVLSGEKIFGTCGVGILYCREGFDHYTPVQWGGGAAQPLNLENRLHVESGPAKMESGTQNIAGIIGMGAAADLIMYSGGPRAINDAVETRRIKLYKENIDQLSSDFELVYGPRQLAKTLCFRSKKYNPSDIAQLLAEQNIAVRAGKICANTYVNKISDNGVLRISIAPYNTDHDCEQLVDGLRHSLKTLKGKN